MRRTKSDHCGTQRMNVKSVAVDMYVTLLVDVIFVWGGINGNTSLGESGKLFAVIGHKILVCESQQVTNYKHNLQHFNHPSVVLTADVFQYFYKSYIYTSSVYYQICLVLYVHFHTMPTIQKQSTHSRHLSAWHIIEWKSRISWKLIFPSCVAWYKYDWNISAAWASRVKSLTS